MILSLKKKRVLTPPKYFHSLPPPQPTCLFASSRLSRAQRRQSPDPGGGPLGSCPLQAMDTTSPRAARTRGDSAPEPDLEPGERGGAPSGYRVSWGGVSGVVSILLLKEPSFFCLLP